MWFYNLFEKGTRFMYYEMTIAGLKRQLPLCKITDELYIGAFIMFSDVENYTGMRQGTPEGCARI